MESGSAALVIQTTKPVRASGDEGQRLQILNINTNQRKASPTGNSKTFHRD